MLPSVHFTCYSVSDTNLQMMNGLRFKYFCYQLLLIWLFIMMCNAKRDAKQVNNWTTASFNQTNKANKSVRKQNTILL